MKITEEYLESLRTENGGYTKETLQSLGVTWPPLKGWRKKLLKRHGYEKPKPWLRSMPTTPQQAPAKMAEFPQSVKSRRIQLFYRSYGWADVRYNALKRSKGCCELCGRGKIDGAVLNVDHIKPLRRYWHLRLDAKNLQVLCGLCNKGKGNRDETDWREKEIEDTERFRNVMADDSA